MKKVIRAKAPARISFAGGGTDVEPFISMYGGCVISSTINKFSYVTVKSNDGNHINIESFDLDSSVRYQVDVDPLFDGKLDLAKMSVHRLMGVTGRVGIDVTTMSEVPPGSGLGTSSTMMVALISALKEYVGATMNKYEIAHLAYKFEREDLKLAGGHQDQYAAAFGGFNYIEFNREGVLVTPLRLSRDIINELELNLLLCYTGRNHISANIIEDQRNNVIQGSQRHIDAMHQQVELAKHMRNLLIRGDVSEFGRTLNVAWEEKKRMSDRISNSDIDELYSTALAHGSIGGKLLGAGGGGYLLLFVPPERQTGLRAELERYGAQFSDFKFEFDGCQAWQVGSSDIYRKLVAMM